MEATTAGTSTGRSPSPRATIDEWLAIPVEQRAELIDGEIVYQALRGPRHGEVQGKTFARVDGPFGRRSGGEHPGGWWFSQEVDMDLGGMGCRPDVLGWRRETHPRRPRPNARGVTTEVPDWVCEVLSRSTGYIDQGKKREGYHRAGVRHYWLIDPVYRTVTVLERADRDYLIVLVAGPDDTVRAAPFEAVEIPVAEVFGDDDEP